RRHQGQLVKGVAMKRFALAVCAALGLMLLYQPCARAGGECCGGGSAAHYGGQQPWWNIFAKRYKCLTPEEERLQKFWHDYYDAMKNYYGALDRIDWVAYYKNHGVAIGGGGCGPYGGGRINYYPVFVNPGFSWAMPAMPTQGPP